MMLRTHAMTASGSGIDGIARCRGPRFSSDTTTAVCCAYLVGWRKSVTGGSWICTLCDLLDRSDFVTWSSLMTSSVSNDDVTAAAGESLVSGHSVDVGRASSTDISRQLNWSSIYQTAHTEQQCWHNGSRRNSSTSGQNAKHVFPQIYHRVDTTTTYRKSITKTTMNIALAGTN